MRDAGSLENLLGKTELFRGLSEVERAKIAEAMTPVTFARSVSIFSRGDAGTQLYVVLEGRVRLSVLTEDGRELAFAHATAGDVFGEIATVDGGPRTADASALTAVKAMALSRPALDRLMSTMPSLSRAIALFVCQRLRATDVKLETIVMHPIEVRLARLFLALARQQGASKGRATVKLDISQGEIALLVGASRPKVNAALMALADQGAVETKGKDFVCDVDTLTEIAGDPGA